MFKLLFPPLLLILLPFVCETVRATQEPSTLLVSAYFPLSKSKHSTQAYTTWLSNFLAHIESPIYFYTPSHYAPTIQAIRGDLPITINTTFNSPFDIPPLQPWTQAYDYQTTLDPENHPRGWSSWKGKKHSAELYAIWNAKPYLLSEAFHNLNSMNNGDLQYKYAFWIDAGSFRGSHTFRQWPSPERLSSVWEEEVSNKSNSTEAQKDSRVFFPIDSLPSEQLSSWTVPDGPFDMGNGRSFSIGSFFGGPVSAVEWYRHTFYAAHDQYISSARPTSDCASVPQPYFVGKDQPLINTLFLTHPERFVTSLAPASVRLPASDELEFNIAEECMVGDPWYYFLYFLASETEQRRMSETWEQSTPFWLSTWWGGLPTRSRCTIDSSKGVKMDAILRKLFGDMWNAPCSHVG